MSDPDILVPMASASNEMQAHLLLHTLAAAGVKAFVADGNANQLATLVLSGIVPARVMVRRADYAVGRAVLETLIAKLSEAAPKHCVMCGYDLAGLEVSAQRGPTCPECGTDHTSIDLTTRPFHIAPPPVEAGAIVRAIGGFGCALAVVVFVVAVAIVIGLALGW